VTASVRNHQKCSQCEVHVTQDNEQYKQYVQTLEFLFPTVAHKDVSGQSPGSIANDSHVVITTLSGESVKLAYNPNQTILSLKDIVEQQLKTPSNKQSLLYNEVELKVL
jgi:hypothetical protein